MGFHHVAASACLLCAAAFAYPAAHVSGSEGARFKRFAVSADHPDASAAGASVLRAGGTAADAAAATMMALGVVSPAGSGLGGGGFALYYKKSDHSLTFLDFRETAPRAATAAMFAARPGDSADQASKRSRKGGLAVAVPGEPLGIETLHHRFGKLPFAQVTAPAEALARGGFAVSEHLTRMLAYLALDAKSDPLFAAVFGAKDDKNARNPALAETLHEFGKRGAQTFYRGRVAQQMVKRVRAEGGVLDARDLAEYAVVERTPLSGDALGFRWVTAPPPSAGGYTVLSSLAMLESVAKGAGLPSGSQRMHTLVESWKGPYLDRTRYFGDPDQVTVPLDALSAPARREARAALFHPVIANTPEHYALPLAPGDFAGKKVEDHGTSHLCVVDAEGNIASVTTTVNLLFGAQISAAGLWLNDEMDDFAREVGKDNAFGLEGGAPNLPAPKKRPVSSMAPSIVFSGDKPVLCIGGSGGSRIPTSVEQVALYMLADGMSADAALDAPRVHHQGSPDRLELRGGDDAMRASLEARGHGVSVTTNSANVQVIRIDADGSLLAGADPNKGGVPAGE